MGRGRGSTGTSTWRTNSATAQTRMQSSGGLTGKLSSIEGSIRGESVEYGFTLDKEGNVIDQTIGTEGSTMLTKPQDSIVTHNHPATHNGVRRADGGGSLSRKDVMAAISSNLAEIRAVTENYTYSLKRPESGWGLDYSKMVKGIRKTSSGRFENYKSPQYIKKERTYKKVESIIDDRLSRYVQSYGGDKAVAWRRAETVRAHLYNKAFAKVYGYEYTKTRVS